MGDEQILHTNPTSTSPTAPTVPLTPILRTLVVAQKSYDEENLFK